MVAREFKGDETLYDVCARSSTLCTKRIIDFSSLKTSYRTITADVTNAYFHVDEDEECYVDPLADWLEQQAAVGDPTSVPWRLRKNCMAGGAPGTHSVDFMAERLEEQSFDRCDAAPQFFANCELDVFIEVHGRSPWHWTETLDLVQTNLSQKIRFKIWTEYEVGMKYEHLKRERVLQK